MIVVSSRCVHPGDELAEQLLGDARAGSRARGEPPDSRPADPPSRSWPHLRPRPRDRSERVAVDLGVDRRGQHLPVTEDLPDLLQTRARPEHLCGRGVAQPVRVQLAEPGASSGSDHDLRDPASCQAMMRSADAHDQRPVQRGRRPTGPQVGDDRLADIARASGSRSSRRPLPEIRAPRRANRRPRSAAPRPRRHAAPAWRASPAPRSRAARRAFPRSHESKQRLQLLGLKRTRQPR